MIPASALENSAPAGLSQSAILAAALALADAEGAAALTMRRLATALNSAPMSLYRHIANKDALLDLLLDAVFAEIALPTAVDDDRRGALRALAYATRAALKRHPWVMPLLNSRPTLGPGYLAWFEHSLALVAPLGTDMATSFRIVGALNAYVLGVVSYEVGEAENERRTGLSEEDKRALAGPFVEPLIASGRYPLFARFIAERIVVEADAGFGFGLDCLLDGLAARLTSPSVRPDVCPS